MKDHMVRIISRSGNVRALACSTTNLVSEACRRHNTFPTASVALGRALTGCALMGALLKEGQRVGMKFEGSGPMKKIIVEGDSDGNVRGYAAVPDIYMVREDGKMDVAGALGRAGFLTVTKDLGLKEPYTGTVQLYTSEIGEDIAYYLTESEQIPSAVGLGVYVEPDTTISAAGGFLIQALPPQDEALIERLMETISQLPSLTMMMKEGKGPKDILELIFNGTPFDIIGENSLYFNCLCTRNKIEKVLISIGKDDLSDLIMDGKASVRCEFCCQQYEFNAAELQELLKEAV